MYCGSILRLCSHQCRLPKLAPVSEPLHVAVGVIQDSLGRVLVARRSTQQHQGGLWEFPGGKVEKGESVRDALCRELYEELGIEVDVAYPFTLIDYRYTDRHVLLDVWRVERFTGVPIARESQPLEWRNVSELDQDEFPAANRQIIQALNSEG
ncbi:MAG TPA: 8-oxo-dGTP diphosphatase MutT [Gammaproteobacteria bacterium]|nr:8-oxo-dGTP diphosphatase MutT [Gammaproteobacteria bacterium]